MNWRTFTIFPTLIALLLSAAACALKPVSLEEAKSLAAEFASNPLLAPRSAADIIKEFQSGERKDLIEFERLRSVADQDPPGGLSPSQFHEFYRNRGDAAGRIGRDRQQIEDFTKATEHSPPGQFAETLFDLCVAEALSADMASAVEHCDRAEAAAIYSSTSGRRLPYMAMTAVFQSAAGNLSAAEELISEASRLLLFAKEWQGYNIYGFSYRAAVSNARAVHLHFEGKNRQAERYLRHALKELDRPVTNLPGLGRKFDEWERSLKFMLGRVLSQQGRFSEAEAVLRDELVATIRLYACLSG